MVNQTVTDYKTNDIWSLGVIIYMIFNGESPFKGKNNFETFDNVKEAKFSYIKKDLPEDVVDLINNILIEDTDKRFNIKQIKEHKYFKDKNVNWETILDNKVPIDLEQLDKIDKLNIQINNNQNYWEQFCNGVNNNTNISIINLFESENDFKVQKKEIIPKIIQNFFYPEEEIQKKMEEIGGISGYMKKCGFKEKEIKLKMNNKQKIIYVYDSEKNDIIKKFELSEKTKVKLEKTNELIIDGERFRSSSSDINNWINNINRVINPEKLVL